MLHRQSPFNKRGTSKEDGAAKTHIALSLGFHDWILARQFFPVTNFCSRTIGMFHQATSGVAWCSIVNVKSAAMFFVKGLTRNIVPANEYILAKTNGGSGIICPSRSRRDHGQSRQNSFNTHSLVPCVLATVLQSAMLRKLD
jgi:hypothetical protein